ncbi:stage V sporulation protein B [Clostridium sp.]|uniref:stage V sporulation protein B n=1 Tax=Clostridium sp. TaxID=1506 RepID=UPI002FC90CA5
MGKDTFYRDTLVLTISNLAMGILRFMFSIILSRQLGPEGVGLYGLIMPIFDLFTCLVCGGLVAALSKETSSYYGTNHYGNLNKSVHATFMFTLIWSVLITIIIFLISPLVSNYIIRDNRSLYSLWIICPALIFIALSSVYKGYFYGVSEVITPSVIDIVEKAVRMFIMVGVINYFAFKDIKSTVAATYFSFTIGEIISFTFLYIFYKRSKRKFKPSGEKCENNPQLLFNVLIMALPLAVNGLLSTAIYSVSTLLVPVRLVAAGFDHATALELIGKFNGMALAIIFFPIVVVASMSTVLIPDISKSITQKDYKNVEIRVSEVIKMCFLLGVSTLLICYIIPNSLGELFFNRTDLGEYIKIAAICAPFLYATSCTYGILNGLGKQKVILINSIVISLIQLALIFVLIGIPSINIMGYGISMAVSGLIGLVMNLYEISKVVSLRFPLGEFLIMSLLTALIGISISVLNVFIPNNIFLLKNIIIISVGFSLFIISTFLVRKSS